MSHSHGFPAEPAEGTGRRRFLKWLTHGLGAAFAATLGVPALLYLLDPRNRKPPSGDFRPVAKLSELKDGQPVAFTIRESRRDAWTIHPSDIVGRVWLIRHGSDVTAFTVTCPHLGCSINLEGDRFVCPCHNGTFTLDGKRTDPGAGRRNPAPRDMDSLEVRLEPAVDDPKDQVVWVRFQVFYQNQQAKVARS
jgi:menaquinol-cytochrome c reductase iron-sulfur subunit